MTNQNGFLLDENGVVRGLEAPISNCKVSGLPRRAYHESLVTNRNLQMVHRVGVVTLTEDGSKPVSDEIREIITDARQLNAQLDKWRDQFFPFSTEGSVVEPQTGAVLPDGTSGAIEQLAFMQALNIPMLQAIGMDVTDQTPILAIQYGMMLQQIQSYDQAGRL